MDFPITKRGLSGLLLGAWVGFLYGVVSTSINPLIIHDIPLYYNFQSVAETVLESMLAVALLGLITNLPYHALPGVVLASLIAAVAVAVKGVLDTADSAEKIVSTLFLTMYTFLPMIILFVPFHALLRWSSQQILEHHRQPAWAWQRIRGWLFMTFLAVLVGSFTLYPAQAQKMMRKMDGFIQAAQSTPKQGVPYEFSQVVDAVRGASAQYALTWTDDLSEYPDPLFYEDTTTAFRLQLVSAYFESGESVFCLFREVDANLYLCTAR